MRAWLPMAVLFWPCVFWKRADDPAAVLPKPVVFAGRADAPVAVLSEPVIVEFPANPRNAFRFEDEPNAKGEPPRLMPVLTLTAPLTSSVTVGVVVPMPMFPAVFWKMRE